MLCTMFGIETNEIIKMTMSFFVSKLSLITLYYYSEALVKSLLTCIFLQFSFAEFFLTLEMFNRSFIKEARHATDFVHEMRLPFSVRA